MPGQQSGLEIIRGWVESRAAPQPFNETTGMAFVHAVPGMVVNEMRPGLELTDEQGQLVPGVAAAVADSALGASVFSLLPPGWGPMSVQLRLDLCPEVVHPTDCLSAHGQAVHVGAGTGLSQGHVVDAEENVRAYASCRSVIGRIDGGPEDGPFVEYAPNTLPRPAPPPPLRLAPEAASPADLGAFLALATTRRLGMEIVEVGERSTVVRMPPTDALANYWGVVHGGAVALFADTAIAVALHALLPGGSALAPLDLTVNFLRPMPVREAIDCHAELVQLGRRFAVVRAEVRVPGDRPAAVALATAFIADRR